MVHATQDATSRPGARDAAPDRPRSCGRDVTPLADANLVNDIDAYFAVRARHGQGDYRRWYVARLRRAVAATRRLRRPLALASGVVQRLPARTAPRLVFDGLRFLDLIRLLARRAPLAVVARKPTDVPAIVAAGARPIPAWTWYPDLVRALDARERGAQDDAEAALRAFVAGATDGLERVNARALISVNDSLPFERGLIHAARRLSLPTITLQHGYFGRSTPIDVLDGHYGDALLVWGDAVRERYLDLDPRNAERVWTFGYPYALPRPAAPRPGDAPARLGVIGKPVDAYAAARVDAYLGEVAEVFAGARRAGLPVTYRRHPAEGTIVRDRLGATFPNVAFDGHRQAVPDFLGRHAVVAGWGSTMLVEGALAGRQALDLASRAEASELALGGIARAVPPQATAVEEALRAAADRSLRSEAAVAEHVVRVLDDPAPAFLRLVDRSVSRRHATRAPSQLAAGRPETRR